MNDSPEERKKLSLALDKLGEVIKSDVPGAQKRRLVIRELRSVVRALTVEQRRKTKKLDDPS